MSGGRLFPYFGAKWKAAAKVWDLLGDPACYVEPFGGSLAVLLSRPLPPGAIEIVSDLDGLLTNFWRAIQHDPAEVLARSAGPVIEAEVESQHAAILEMRPTLERKMVDDVSFYDPQVAAWWWRGISSWLGSGFGVKAARQRPHIDRTLKGLFSVGMTDERVAEVAARLAGVMVLSGDWKEAWKRGMTDSVINRFGPEKFGAFLDPPYTKDSGRISGLYAEDAPLTEQITSRLLDLPVGSKVVLAGYEDEYPALIDAGWSVHRWKAPNGYAQDGNGRRRFEALLASPGCDPVQSPT